MAVEEYRFQVRLNWERTRDYFILNGALVSVALGLQRFGDFANNLLVGLMLLLACGVGLLGAFTHRTGHKYYRRTIYKKTLFEDILGLARKEEGYAFEGATLAITSTAGHTETTQILHHTKDWLERGLRRGSIVSWVFVVLSTFSALELIGGLYYPRTAFRYSEFWVL